MRIRASFRHNHAIQFRAVLTLLAVGLITACANTDKLRSAKLTQPPFINLQPGYSYLQEVTGPGPLRQITWVFMGQEDSLYRWELYRGRDTDAKPWQIQWLNTNGAAVKYSQARNNAQWKPHNCFRVIGECSFSYTDTYGVENQYLRNGRSDGRSWTYQLFRVDSEARDLITNGTARFDQNGIEIFHEYFTNNNGHQLSKVTEVF